MNTVRTDLQTAIAAIRQEKRLSKADMAKAMDIDPSNYNRLEGRGNKLTIEQVASIADALGVGLIELLTWGDEKPQPTDRVDVSLLERELAKSDELIKLQKEKINYLISVSYDLIIGYAFNEFQEDVGLNDVYEDLEAMEMYFVPDKEEWRNFLTNYIHEHGWVTKLIERGVVEEERLFLMAPETVLSAPVPRDIKRKLQKRRVEYDKLHAEFNKLMEEASKSKS